MFRAVCGHHQGSKMYYTASGIVTPVDGRLREDSVNTIVDGCILCSLASRIVTVYSYVNTGRY